MVIENTCPSGFAFASRKSKAIEMSVLKEGDIIALEGGIMHELKANEESIVWLGLHKGDSVDRVKSILKESTVQQ